MKAAFMIIDLQKAHCQGEAAASMRAACEYINEVLPHFRRLGLPVIWVQDVDKGSGVVPGSPGFDIMEELEPLEGEARIHKEYGNSFNKTGAARILDEAGLDTVILSGYCAEHCVLSTYRGAKDLDLVPILLRGGIASGSRENLGFVERISEVISWQALEKALG